MAKKSKKIGKEFIVLSLEDIHPYENNPRLNEDAVPYVVESIKQCTDLDPIEVDENNVILSGHTRLLAMQKLGYKEADCIRYSGLTEAQKKKYRLLANKVAEKSFWDFDKLAEELDGLNFDGFDFGFDSDFSQYGNTTQAINQVGEVELENFNDDKFECECPKCGFKFNREQ